MSSFWKLKQDLAYGTNCYICQVVVYESASNDAPILKPLEWSEEIVTPIVTSIIQLEFGV